MLAFKPGKLQIKFIAGLAAIMAVIGVFFVFLLQQYLRETLEQEARGKAQVILRGAESLHAYVQDNLRPVITGALLENKGLLEAMSCTALARASMSVPGPVVDQGAADGYRFRRVAIGARSPDLEAVGQERAFIDMFQEDHARQWAESITMENGQEFFVLAQPVRYQGFCLRCHGDPAQAPRDLVESYGAQRGFNRKEGELAGAHVVRLPMQGGIVRIQGATLGFVLMFSVGAIFLFVTIYVFFNRLVVHNLRRALSVMGRHFPEAADQVPSPPSPVGWQSADEIENLQGSMEKFADSLRQARLQLQSYAANLESMVEERTQDLSREAEARRADVGLFVSMLNDFNRSRDRSELLAGCLELIGKRFGAWRVSYCCTMSGGHSQTWPPEASEHIMPAGWERMAAGGTPDFRSGIAYIPVQSSDTALGMLTLCWTREDAPDPMPVDVLMAVGQQLGVVLENMDALDNLLRQNALLHAVFEGITDPVILLDAHGQVVLANRSARALGLFAPIDPGVASLPLGTGGEDLLAAQGIEQGRELPPACLSEPSVRDVGLPDGRAFMVSLYPLPDFRGVGGRLVVYAREITGERRMQELAQQNEKLLAVGRLAAGLAHEINNPLGVILFYGELLKASLAEGGGLEDVEVILKHTRQAQKVLQGLLNFVRPKKGALAPCDLALAARQTARVFQGQAASEGVSLLVEAPDGLPPITADATALEQILSNLLINALDAVAPGTGRIRVQVERDGDHLVLRVADNGPGIAPQDMPRVFEPFFTTKEVGKGTGLGLAVVFGLVNDMGGSVEAHNQGGACFVVRLPLAGPRAGLRAGGEEGGREAA